MERPTMQVTNMLSLAITGLFLFPGAAQAKSSAVRKKDPVSFNLHATPRSDHFHRLGLSFGYSIGKRFELSGLAMGGQQTLNQTMPLPTNLSTTKSKGLAIQGTVNGRLFLTESLSILLGAGYRQTRVDYAFADNNSERNATANYKLEDGIVLVGLGNQWALKSGVNFGIDWGLLSVPLKKQVTTTIKTNGLTEDEAVLVDQSTLGAVNQIAKEKSMTLGLVTLGLRF
jgi:hypothetical protein